MTIERGIVISPPFKIACNGAVHIGGSPGAHDPRKCLKASFDEVMTVKV